VRGSLDALATEAVMASAVGGVVGRIFDLCLKSSVAISQKNTNGVQAVEVCDDEIQLAVAIYTAVVIGFGLLIFPRSR
jgi:small basic protein